MKFKVQISLDSNLLVAVALLLVFQTQECGAIKCFECKSDYDPYCADPFDNSTFDVTDCDYKDPPQHDDPDVKYTFCRKIRYQLHGEWKQERGCGFLGQPDKLVGDKRPCLTRTTASNILMEICSCNDKEGCNSSSKLTLLPLLLASSVITAMVNTYLD